jgi:uncharacterized protein (DUF362 family)
VTADVNLAQRASVGIQAATDAPGVAAAIDVQSKAVGLKIRSGEVWAVKLNLTYPEYLPGVVNSPIFTEGLCQWARDCGVRLILIEGDGGNGSYSAQDTFDANQVTAIARRYGMTLASISEKPWDWRETDVAGRTVRLPYSPFFTRRQYDRFVTAPLFKNHIFTIVSLGMKNLWGCIPDAYRMYYHHLLDHGIVALTKELRPDFAIFDGIVALRGRGPMDGQPVEMGAVMLANTVGAAEAAALQVMNVRLEEVRHLMLARDEGLLPDAAGIVWTSDPAPFIRRDFIINRSWLNHATIALGHFPRLQRVIYHSPVSRAIYLVVDRLRPGSAQARLVAAKRRGAFKTIDLQDR